MSASVFEKLIEFDEPPFRALDSDTPAPETACGRGLSARVREAGSAFDGIIL
jgi:hypothetical protein